MEYRTLGVIGAMDEEVERFLLRMEDAVETVKAGIRFREGEWNGKRVIVCKCGVGKVNAAVCTQLLIDTFGVEAVIFTGVAGAVHPELNIGDIVVSTDCLQHDMDVTPLGFAKGVIPYAEESTFQAEPSLVEAALAAGESLYPGLTRAGRILSGDQFVASRESVASLHRDHQGACVEMEGAAVAQVCRMNGTPFVVLRSMSDKADGSAHVNFPEFTKLAAERSAAIVERMLGVL
ncbi:5'-methylthioadenosine/adenosylhomocysteine nucleosidase [Paenibacillus sp.]|uniref:5'-methylthioadenosine/adenosylhomocysteine nucleosidase n=1 Tax=Paenibacillus sp. TaxID=58172 RepID=UPI002D592C30|nr:5'-methylthioadenosine/adenosylhomocysteine nucleosidase [Paenibacillus sp.]HZG54937.1 5'-methylthioadenosine/adenosylhomocysteine nucleosidase [Paenibacillus sp.]